MKFIHKAIAGFLAALLVFSLAGCSVGGTRTDAEDRAQLMAILNDLSSNMHPGTAGSSLTSARLATNLIVWASTTKMDKKEAAGIVLDWLREQSPEIQAAFREKISSVSDSYSRILKDGASDLLASAGINQDLSNLKPRLKEIVESILASGGLD